MAFHDTVMDVIASAQTEIAIFLVAVCAHFLLFSKHTVSGGKHSAKKLPPKECPKPNSDKPSPRKPSANLAFAPLVRSVQTLINERAGKDAIAAEITRFLGRRPEDERVDVLLGVISSLGKHVSCEAAGAIRAAIKELRIEGAGRVNEMILRSYIFLRAKEDFESFLDEVLASSAVSPTVHTIALRAACTFGDLTSAFSHLPGVAPALRSTEATPSVACHQLFLQLARLSLTSGELARLLQEMRKNSLASGTTVQALFQECARHSYLEELVQVQDFARTEKVGLTSGCFVALLHCARDGATAMRHLEAASAAQKVDKDVLLAGVGAASKFRDAGVAKFVLGHASAASPEVAQGLLQLCAHGGPLGNSDSDTVVLELYETRLAGSGFAMDGQAERLVAEAALRCQRDEALKMLLRSPMDTSRQVFLLKSFSHDRRLSDCLTLFRACSEKSVPICNAMLDACVDNGDLELAEMLMGEAVDAQTADVVTYNTMVKAYLRQGGIRRAKQLIGTMQGKGLRPNCVTFNELLDGTLREKPEAMWDVVREMQASGCRPNHVTCSIVLKSVSKASRANEVEKALAVVDAMHDPIDEVLLSSMCEACIRSGRTDLLRVQLERQKVVTIKGAQTFGSVIRAYGSLNDVDKVWDTWREMRKRGIVPTSVTMGCTVEALAANGHVDAAYELIREQMEDPQVRPMVNAVIYCSVLKGFSHRKRFDRVWAVYEEMKAEKLECSIVTFNTLVDACARSGEMSRIPMMLEDMAAQRIEPNVITFSAIIKGYCQDNRLDRAFELLEDMKKNRNLKPDEVTYNTLIDGCARYGLYDRGVGVLREMEEMGVPPSNFTLSVLVKLANRGKHPDKAFELCDTICGKYRLRLCVHVYNNLIFTCTSHQRYQKAFDVFAEMLRERVRPDTRTYTLLLRAAVSERSAEDVAGLLRAAARRQGAHPQLLAAAGGLAALAPKGGLPRDAVSEALEGLANFSADDKLLVQLLRELRDAPGVSLDPRLPMRLTSQAAKR